MSFKTHAAARCSARFKFKTPDCVELVIIDTATNEIFTILWNFRVQPEPVVTKKKRAKDAAPQTNLTEEIIESDTFEGDSDD